MKFKREYVTVLILITVLAASLPAMASERAEVSKAPASFTYHDVKKADEEVIREYSGKDIIWYGTLRELVSNDAYFEYVFELPSGDEIKVLSGRGIKFKYGDYLRLEGFIMVKKGKFSHVVLHKAQMAQKQDSFENFAGLIPLDAPKEVIYNKILAWINWYNPGVSDRTAKFIANRIVHYSSKHNTDPFLVTALISAESAFNVNAVSVAGAVGPGQLMPGTAAVLGVDPWNPDQNIRGSVIYLKTQLDRWKNSKAPVAYALASYNAGPGAVMKYGGIPLPGNNRLRRLHHSPLQKDKDKELRTKMYSASLYRSMDFILFP